MATPSSAGTLLLVDAHALLHRSFHALPPTMSTAGGMPTNALYGFALTFLKAVEEFSPTHAAICFDDQAPTLRHGEYAEYKAHRKAPDDALLVQLDEARSIPEAFGIPVYFGEGHEADDYLGCLAMKATAAGMRTIILTGDKDTLQLVNDSVSVSILTTGVKNTELLTPVGVRSKYGMDPSQMIDYKALRGDPSDNIPGVPGIGDKTALKLLQKHRTLDGVYAHIDDDPEIKGAMKTKLVTFKEQAYLSKRLATIRCDIDLVFDPEALRLDGIDRAKALAVFQRLEFGSLLPRLQKLLPKKDGDAAVAAEQPGLFPAPPKAEKKAEAPKPAPIGPQSFTATLVTDMPAFEALLAKLERQTLVAFDTETPELDPLHTQLCGMSFCFDEREAFYVDFCHTCGTGLGIEAMEQLKPFFANPAITKVAHNVKFDGHVLANLGIEVVNGEDTLLLAYLANPGARGLGLAALALQELGYEMQQIEALIGKGKKQITFAEVDPTAACFYSAEDAWACFRLHPLLLEKVRVAGHEEIYRTMDLPLLPVLMRMERDGISVDTAYLDAMAKEFLARLGELEGEIQELAGHAFNLNSPEQVAHVLYEELGLAVKGIKKTQKSLSTAAEELEKLDHPIATKLLEYREIEKLRGTYVEALPALVDPDDGRVHTSYNQAVAATGRLSSTDPNLQNIPIRTALGRRIRKAFVAAPGYTLLSADYSQIELRLLAHVSNDPNLIAVYRENRDIHAQTAAFLYGVEPGAITTEQRIHAKTVNFGILYGMGPRRLAKENNLTVPEAALFIERYFASYPYVSLWMERLLKEAKVTGYVETIFGRRRFLPELQSGRGFLVAQGERMALNHPLQGSAADLMKRAMIAIDATLRAKRLKSRALLQVHDELVLEAAEGEEAQVAAILREHMEGAATLNVPLVAEVKQGRHWGEMEPFPT